MIFKNKKEAEKVYKQYCEHLGKGFSKDSFVYCDYRTIENAIKKYKLKPDLMSKAKRESKFVWEKIGKDGTEGKFKGFNAKSWEFNMKNRFGWTDKHEFDHTVINLNLGEKEKKL